MEIERNRGAFNTQTENRDADSVTRHIFVSRVSTVHCGPNDLQTSDFLAALISLPDRVNRLRRVRML